MVGLLKEVAGWVEGVCGVAEEDAGGSRQESERPRQRRLRVIFPRDERLIATSAIP